MNRFHTYFYVVLLLLSAFIAYGWRTLPTPKDQTSKVFSSARVVKDLQIIAQEPHSVAHPEAKAKVRDYLKTRLENLGGKVQIYSYPSQKAKGYTFQADNIFAEFLPINSVSDTTTYLLLVAHYDSKYPMKRKQGTVSSFGAGDDGYGVGVILESLNQALNFRENWNQGIRVLFTDAEEVGMIGMKAAYQKNKELFDRVGLVLNIEARGLYGPALLFETSPGNEKLMELYANHARYPYTYSLTSVVYRFMPNDTDFSLVKDTLPGMNFSVIGDVNLYHTEQDNLNHICETSIQHYGEQLVPLLRHYLTDPLYTDAHYLHAKTDTVYFTIPLLGFFHFSPWGYRLLNISIFLLLFGLLGYQLRKRIFTTIDLLKQSGKLLLIAISILFTGELLAWICAQSVGVRFHLFGTVSGISFDNEVMIAAACLLGIGVVAYLYKQRTSSLPLYSTLLIQCVCSALLLFTLGENLMFFIPLAFATLALVLWQITHLKLFLWIAMIAIALHTFSFLYIVALALTIGALGAVLFIAFLDLLVIFALPNQNKI